MSSINGTTITLAGWPKRSQHLGDILRRLAPNLRRVEGLNVEWERTNRRRTISITRGSATGNRDSLSPSSLLSPTQANKDFLGDDDPEECRHPVVTGSSPPVRKNARKTPVGDNGDKGDNTFPTLSDGSPGRTLRDRERDFETQLDDETPNRP